MGTLLLVHAHPDDEAISTGGVMQKASADGHRVVLVTATRGEVGEIYNMDEATTRPHLGEVRAKELENAARILGVNRGEFLNYRDSGMVGTADNENPKSFHQAPLPEAAARLAAILREERPDVVVTYDADGTYGHPDHIKAHHVTNAALDLLEKEGWRPSKLYYTGIPRTLMQQFMAALPDDVQNQEQRANMTIPGTPDELITTQIDVSDYVDRKREAFAAHVTQIDPNSWFATMADQIYRLAFGTEYFRLARGKPGSKLPENDLFVGVPEK
ncbi:MAG TPA: N-acetyl-1-D-myo-inositol-2-amino-2-deoxy-alpha-D-glucopyranoside deacetylase [Candidatus Acidoferrum sp.]|jgi:N-acetyl-1-D-myo-inositol-2-amino-2-deoxy-alpha-D-glucopyranoside deacetylase|nr:N-acetyl-1-D-myo-inositol-2-amino-2-deoxy-alpha-D-glucopyranoside deacetylase [Candidatus Acidoferrum sp.]